MAYISSDLVHFVGQKNPVDDDANWKTLVAVMESEEVWAGKSGPEATILHRDMGKPMSGNKRYEPSVACFADIPPDELGIHTGKYGRFGLALPKAKLATRGVRPVTYIPYAVNPGIFGRQKTAEDEWDDAIPTIEQAVMAKFGGHTAAPPGSREQRLVEDFLDFQILSYVKFFDARKAENHRDNFYYEREWRAVSGIEFSRDEVTGIYVAEGWRARAEAEFSDVDPSLIVELPEGTAPSDSDGN